LEEKEMNLFNYNYQEKIASLKERVKDYEHGMRHNLLISEENQTDIIYIGSRAEILIANEIIKIELRSFFRCKNFSNYKTISIKTQKGKELYSKKAGEPVFIKKKWGIIIKILPPKY
jgi:hypothetical protein